jgi:hypothetical protein
MDPLIRDKILLWAQGWKDLIVPQGSDQQPQVSPENAGQNHELSALEQFDRDTREIAHEFQQVGEGQFLDETEDSNSIGGRVHKRRKNEENDNTPVKKRKEDPSLPPSRYLKNTKVDMKFVKRGHIQEKKYALTVRISLKWREGGSFLPKFNISLDFP